jgi:hypothetical protein
LLRQEAIIQDAKAADYYVAAEPREKASGARAEACLLEEMQRY